MATQPTAKEMKTLVRQTLHDSRVQEAFRMECNNHEVVERFTHGVYARVVGDKRTLRAAYHSRTGLISAIKPFVKYDLEIPREFFFVGHASPNAKTGQFGFTAYITAKGMMRICHRLKDIVVHEPVIVRQGDEFDLSFTVEDGRHRTHMTYRHASLNPAHEGPTGSGRPIIGGYIAVDFWHEASRTWTNQIVYLDREKLDAARAKSHNQKMYQEFPDRMNGNILRRALKHVVPLQGADLLTEDATAVPEAETEMETEEAAPAEVETTETEEVEEEEEAAPPPPPAKKKPAAKKPAAKKKAAPPPPPKVEEPPAEEEDEEEESEEEEAATDEGAEDAWQGLDED